MAIRRKDGKFECSICGKIFSQHQQADTCRDSHEVVSILMLQSDLQRLLQFVYTREEKLLTRSMITALEKGVKGRNDEMPTLS